jgi:hypothetical protein
MTTAGGGASGVESGSDYVTARLGVDVDSGSMQGLQELTKEIERFHTAMEATVRSEADMTRYLDQMAEGAKTAAAAQTNLTQQLNVFLQLQGRMAGGGGMGMGYPGVGMGAAVNPFQGILPGMGQLGGTRPPNPTDVVWQLASVAGRSPAEASQFMSMGHPRGNLTSADTMNISPQSIQALADRIAEREKAVMAGHKAARPHTNQPARQGTSGDPAAQLQQRIGGMTGLASQVMNEVGGTGISGAIGLASRGLNWAGAKLGKYADKKQAAEGDEDGEEEGSTTDVDDKTSGLTKAAKAIPIVGGVLAGAAGIFDLVGKAGQMEQSWRNIGEQRGGAAGQGFEASMRARSTAMDPNITSSQARSMYQAAISEGYATASGGGATDIIELFRDGIKKFNMNTDEMLKELRLLRVSHDQIVSPQAIQAALAATQIQSQTGYMSAPEINANKMAQMQTQIAQGVGPASAYRNAGIGAQMYADNPGLAGTYSNQTFNKPSVGMMEAIHGGPGGSPLPPPTGMLTNYYDAWLDRTGKGDEAKANMTKQLVNQFKNMKGDVSGGINRTDPAYFMAMKTFSDFYSNTVDNTLSADQLEALYLQYAWGKTLDGDPVTSDPHQVVADARKADTAVRRKSGDFDVKTHGGGHPGGDQTRKTYSSHMTDNIVAAYGGDLSQIQVGDGKGGWTTYDPHSQKQQAQLASGEVNWRHTGDRGAGIKVEDTPDDISKRFSTDNPWGTAGSTRKNPNAPGGGGQVHGELTVTIDQAGVAHAPKTIPLSPTQSAANSAQRGAQVNQTPPGDRGFDRTTWAHP